MASRLLALAALLLCLAACVTRDRLNPNCRWSDDQPRRLDLGRTADRNHLIDDAQLAEELAIRHADSIFKRGFAHPREYAATRDACMAALFDEVASRHDVPAALVRDFVDRSRLDFIVAVFMSFAFLYALAAWAVVRIIRRRAAGERRFALAAILASSLVLGVAGLMLGDPWWGVAQDLRLGTSHASYRAFRNPWVRHPVAFLAADVVIVWLIAPLAWKARGGHEESAKR